MHARRPMDDHAQLLIETTITAVGPVLLVTGEIDAFTATAFESALMALDVALGQRVVVDLAEVTFIDSAGLRRLLTMQRHFSKAAIEFVLRRPSAIVRRLLEITMLDAALTIEN